jgi:hypothetical protein
MDRGCLRENRQIANTFKNSKNIICTKSSSFWHITPCVPLKTNQCFGEIICVRLQGRRIIIALLFVCFMLVSYLAYPSALNMEATVRPKHLLTFNGLTVLHSIRYNCSYPPLWKPQILQCYMGNYMSCKVFRNIKIRKYTLTTKWIFPEI